MKNKYLPVAISMYINYIIIGVSVLILSLNMDPLMEQLGTNKAGMGLVISGLGIGKFSVFIGGILSDKFGRRPNIMAGMVGFIIFFIGILFSTNVTVAIAFAVLAGIANGLMDSGTYPALMESFPDSPGTANIMIKAFCSLGAFALPVLVSFITTKGMYYGISFYVLVGILVLNIIFMFTAKFPPLSSKKSKDDEEIVDVEFKSQPKMGLEGIFCIFIGFTSTATFTIVSIWLPKFAQEIGMPQGQALELISKYSIGSLAAVFITALLVKRMIKPAVFIFIYPAVSALVLLALYLNPIQSMCTIAAYGVGFFGAGGVLQLAVTTMAELFPTNKGKITGLVNTMNCLAVFGTPAITGVLAQNNMINVILFDVVITAAGAVFGLVVMLRYKQIFGSKLITSKEAA